MYHRIQLRCRLRPRPPRGIECNDFGARLGERRHVRACRGDEDVGIGMRGFDDANYRRLDRAPHGVDVGNALDTNSPATTHHGGACQGHDMRGFF